MMADQASQGFLSPILRSARLAAARPWLRGQILDVGCGSGALAAFASEDTYFGCDYDEASIELARLEFPGYEFAASLPTDRKFDTIAALALVEHLPAPREDLSAWSGLLAPGGRIVITTPHRAFRVVHDIGSVLGLFSRDAAEEHEEMFDRRSLEALGAACNLRMVHYGRFLMWANQLAVFEPATAKESVALAENTLSSTA